jgi:L-ascorbate metabolism protein UlaG (beta-lactamase superfamily)
VGVRPDKETRQPQSPLRVTLLNHASVILDLPDGVSLLADPWFSGTCFRDGWGLRYDNPAALTEARRCTHLWISHFHGDHFHVPTLRALVAQRPDIQVLANASVNLGGERVFQELGFERVTYVNEREPIQLTDTLRITRIPTTRIDSMLLLETPSWRILNFNDCVLPIAALETLRRRIGGIDLLLNNYNHAGKLLDYPARPADEVRAAQLRTFVTTVRTLQPRWVIPFASLHYYRAPETTGQNESLLEVDELAASDPRVVPVPVGGRATLRHDQAPHVETVHVGVTRAPLAVCAREPGASPTELVAAADAFWSRMRRHFGPMLRLLPALIVNVSDQDMALVAPPAGGATITARRDDAAIGAHSRALAQWFGDPFGTDAFYVGGHFAIRGPSLRLVRLLIMLGVMVDGRITPRDLLGRLRARGGWTFLWNRREEIVGLLLGRRLPIGDRV